VYLPPLDPDVEAALGRAVDVIDGASSLAIACHIAPDGDALGCALALALAFKDRGIEVQAGWDGESIELPAQYDFLPGANLLTPSDNFRPADVAIAVDCASADRLGRLRERMEKARALVNLDHHVSNTRFGGVNVIDEEASSSAELVVHLLARMGAEITADIATCLYTGLITDTGQFAYASVTPRTHAVASFLIQRGVKVDEVAQNLYERYRFSYLKVLGRVLERATLESDPTFVLSYLTKADREELGVSMDDTDDVIDVLRSVRDADVTCLLKERDDGVWKGSFRSKGRTDVGSVAQQLGGGGHKLAAGFELNVPFDEAVETIRNALAAVQRA
jgi:bifunctional oligoribonuclease and PAP phosphatase NrnA